VKRVLTVFTLAMINVAAIGSVKNWPVTAEYGFSSLFYLILSALVFFIPVSLVSAELATGWPKIGGVFVWVKEAFGHRTGFLAVWLLWFENVFWYPTILSFIAATITYIFDPNLANNPTFMITTILVIFWATTFANMFGMRASSWISTIGVLFGTLIPGVLIIALGFFWYFQGKPLQISLTADSLIPDLTNIDQMVIFIGIMLSLAGMEMSAIHARDVKNPQKDYPRAILLSVLIILGFSILGVLAIAFVIPQDKISLVAGSMQAFSYFVNAYNLNWLTPYMAILVAVGAIGSMSTWTAGPSKGLLAAAENGDLPPIFRRINKHGMPSVLLITQAVIVTFLSLLFLLMPTVNAAFWILTVIVAQLYLVMYIMMFAAAIKLRYKRPNVERAYRVPGGNVGMWIVASCGIISSLYGLIIGFFPPTQITTGNYVFYFGFLIIGMILGLLAPYIILWFKKPHWNKPLSHEKKRS
jgi:putative glutamate/gamma-aminobutyrate antiporter